MVAPAHGAGAQGSTSAGLMQTRQAEKAGEPSPEMQQEVLSARDSLRATFRSGRTRSYEWRLKQLQNFERMFLEQEKAITAALAEDLGRPPYEAILCEIGGTINELRFMMDNLKTWMEPKSVPTPLALQLGDSRIECVPKGVVLVIAPWNFPLNLAFLPAAQAIAAGNCVVIKPSEVTSACSKLAKGLCERYLDADAVRVIEGGVLETTALLEQQWDHIFYTGNGAVARVVMAAAAKHLTPVTLELGGKSPVVVDRGLSDSQLATACQRIMWVAHFINAGQICVSPDYILVHKDDEQRLLQAMRRCMAQFHPRDDTSAVCKIVNERHWDRVQHLVSSSGGEVFSAGSSPSDRASRFIPPTIVSRPDPEAPIMREEIFGPVISVMPVDDLDAAITFIQERETPLALYVFSPDRSRAEHVVSSTQSGGVLINDTFLHLGNPHLPFGGAGSSGMGCYHGKAGFEEFSHKRSIMHRRLWPQVDVYPPYTDGKLSLIRRLQLGPLVPPMVKRVGAVGAALGVAAGVVLRSRL
mmetsp:Transcript_16914/g.37174  ORF Transcript_16914/g.37174 Transcript_16914/m.37174 type:complete len:527 (-) Transcript_16914:76-1656(-)